MKKFALVALGAVVAVCSVLYIRVWYAERRWAATFHRFEKLAHDDPWQNDQYPGSPTCDAVLPGDESAKAAIQEYLDVSLRSSSSTTARPNPSIANYRRTDEDAFSACVVKNFRIRRRQWPPADGIAIPNLLKTLREQKLLLSISLARAAANEPQAAERFLEASWRINESLRSEPILLSQLLAMAVFRYQLAAMRTIGCDARKWLPRIHSVDWVEPFSSGIQLQIWQTDWRVRHNYYASNEYIWLLQGLGRPRPLWSQLLRTPLRWFNFPAFLEANREMIDSLATASRSERVDIVISAAYYKGLHAWLRFPDNDPESDDDLSQKPLGGLFRRAVRANAERELTERVLATRAGLPFDSTSAIENATWICEKTEAGARIRMSREIDWGSDMSGTWSALEYEVTLRSPQ